MIKKNIQEEPRNCGRVFCAKVVTSYIEFSLLNACPYNGNVEVVSVKYVVLQQSFVGPRLF
jgi:hypothetical protein